MSATNQLINANNNPNNLLGDYFSSTQNGGDDNTTKSSYLVVYPGIYITTASVITLATSTFNNTLPSGQGRLVTSVTYNFQNSSLTNAYTLLLYYTITFSDTTAETGGQLYLTIPVQTLSAPGANSATMNYQTTVNLPTGNFTIAVKCQNTSSSNPPASTLSAYAVTISNIVGTVIQ